MIARALIRRPFKREPCYWCFGQGSDIPAGRVLPEPCLICQGKGHR